ncbi:hypothetical protein M758_4G170300 [Ceratodon purpureus]|nr:hypothetical protein M758_4G170300 [Ceratodon purpureus]
MRNPTTPLNAHSADSSRVIRLTESNRTRESHHNHPRSHQFPRLTELQKPPRMSSNESQTGPFESAWLRDAHLCSSPDYGPDVFTQLQPTNKQTNKQTNK